MKNAVISAGLDSMGTDLDPRIFSGKRVVVLGGAGFIGSWTCDALVMGGAVVDCFDRLSTGSEENIGHLLASDRFSFERLDISEGFKSGRKYDLVIHLASRASPEEYQLYPIDTLRTNSLGTLNALEIARNSDGILLFASSSEVYGDATQFPTQETYWGNVNPIGVRSCYDEGKRFGEALCMAYMMQYGIDIRIVRIFNTYGPRMRTDGAYGRVVPRFIDQALSQSEITIYGDGTQTRSFTYVTDTVSGILRAVSNPKARGEVLNLGSQQETRIVDLAKMIMAKTWSNSKIVSMPLPKDDPKRRLPDISKARDILGWEPKTKLEDGLEYTIEWISSRRRLAGQGTGSP